MSYILEALRKSDQQRQRGAAPTLLLGQATTATSKPQVPGWFYGLLAVVLVGAGIFIGWLRPWQAASRAAEPVFVRPPELGLSPRASVGAEATLQPEPLPAAVHPAAVQPAPVMAQTPARTQVAMHEPAPKAADPEPSPAAARTADAAAPAQPVVSMADLPVEIQQELPPLSISVHAYSASPRERLVGINSRLMREGDSPAPGLVLEQITREGMVLSYRGYRFRRGVQ